MNLDEITSGDIYGVNQPETPKNEPRDYLRSGYRDIIGILLRKDSEDGLTVMTLQIRDGDKRFTCSRKVRFPKSFSLELESAEAELVRDYKEYVQQRVLEMISAVLKSRSG